MDTGLRQYRSSCDLSQCGQWEQGRFRSRWYLGLSCGMEWLRLTVDGTADMRVRVYACDQPPEDFRDIEDTPSLERTARDLLLYGVTGQYLSFTVEPGEALRGFALSFPGRSIAEGLPFILQEDNTLRALLAVCQSEYMDLTAQIRRFPERLNPAHPDALPQLSRWLGAQPWVGDRSAAQKILPYAPLLTRMRGTRRGLQMLALLVTGYPCRVMEEYSRARYSTGAEEGLSILVPSCVARKAVQSLKRLLPDFIPVGISYSLIHLKDSAPMDGHCYLDENASLTDPPACELDGVGADEVMLE